MSGITEVRANQPQEFRNHEFRNSAVRTLVVTAKVIATATIIFPILSGMWQLYEGYPRNSVRGGSFPSEKNSMLEKIILISNIFLAFELGYDHLWSDYSFRDISRKDLKEIKEIPLNKLSADKLNMLLPREDCRDFFLSKFNTIPCAQLKDIVSKIELENLLRFLPELKPLRIMLCIYYLSTPYESTRILPFYSLLQVSQFQAIFNQLNDRWKEVFFETTCNCAQVFANQGITTDWQDYIYNQPTFVESLSPDDILLLNLLENPAFQNRLTNEQKQKVKILQEGMHLEAPSFK